VFDHRQRWFGTCPGPTPSPFNKFTPEARKLVRAIEPLARANKPDAGLAAAITKMLSAFDTKP
jgi:hypothetical protein